MRGAAWNDARQRPVVAPNRRWRRPRRLDVLAIDGGRAGPLHAGAANAHRISDRLACTNNVIKAAFAGADDDRSRHCPSPTRCRHGPAPAQGQMRMPQWRLRRPQKAWSFSALSHSLITDCSADAAAQRDSTQAQSNQNSLFLSNETAIGLIWPGCATAETK